MPLSACKQASSHLSIFTLLFLAMRTTASFSALAADSYPIDEGLLALLP